MKRKKFIFLMTSVCLFCMTGCIHHNGNIGHWFGQWKLTQITVNEESDTTYNGNIFWSFQSNIILMQGQGTSRGTWEEDGDNLVLTFTYSDDYNPQGSPAYSPLPATHLPAGVSTLRILKSPGTKMELQYVSPEGDKYQYSLSKWW